MTCVDSVLKLPVHQKLDLQSLDLQLQSAMSIEWSPAENYDVVFQHPLVSLAEGNMFLLARHTTASGASTPSTEYQEHRLSQAWLLWIEIYTPWNK